MSNENSNISVNTDNSNVEVVNNKKVSFNDNVEVKEIINEDITSDLIKRYERSAKEQKKLQCYNCNKIFKSLISYNNHVRTQSCFNTKDKSYCNTCDKLFKNRDELDDHLLSLEHYNCVNNLSMKPLIKTNQKYSLDPILNKEDVHKMNTIDIGSNITFIYNDDNVVKQEIKIKNYNSNSSIDSNIINISNDNTNNIENNKDNDIERKKKIIDFLINNSNSNESSKNFLKLLNKLSIEDYSGLNNAIITNNDIPVLAKQQYVKTIQTFISLLIKKKNKGEKNYNNYNIEDIVTAITK